MLYQIRARSESLEWVKAVKERDNYTCQHCGESNLMGHNCHAHHIRDFNNYPELRYNLDKGVTLCAKCHRKVHRRV